MADARLRSRERADVRPRGALLALTAFAAAALGILAACSSGSEAEDVPELPPGEVEQLFAEWLCPSDPDYALASYRPSAEFREGQWRVAVQDGTFRAHEPHLVFMWDEPRLGERMLTMRSEDRCG